ncbi:MAG: translation initiation factor [Myxococcaceae bacterium]
MKKKIPLSAPGSTLSHQPFASLSKRMSATSDTQPKSEEAEHQKPRTSQTPVPRGPPLALVRLETKGHSGKEVTVIEKLDLSLVQRTAWLTALKQALGCGGKLDGDALVLQGDQRERLAELLSRRGVRRVQLG